MSVAHEPDCLEFPGSTDFAEEICNAWCFGCGRCEPCRDGDCQSCPECFHVFRTPGELVALDAKHRGHAIAVEDIHICPICTHDFLGRP